VVSVHDLAAYILRALGPMTAMKLQKLVYYCQAWSLVRDERPVFDGRIEAWANGPVSPALYQQHRKQFVVGPTWPRGNLEAIDAPGRATVDVVLDFYGTQSADWLSQLTHRERPWMDAREGLQPGQTSKRVITHAAMAEYYGSLI